MKGIPPGHPQIKHVPNIHAVLATPYDEGGNNNVVLWQRGAIRGDFNGFAAAMHKDRAKFYSGVIRGEPGLSVPVRMDFQREWEPEKRLEEFSKEAETEIAQAVKTVLNDLNEIKTAAMELGAKHVEIDLRSVTTYDASAEKIHFWNEDVLGRVLAMTGIFNFKKFNANILHFDTGPSDEKNHNPDFEQCRILFAYGTVNTEFALNEDVDIDRKGNPHLKFGRSLGSMELGDVWKQAVIQDAPKTKPLAHRGPIRQEPQLLMTVDIL